jgi:4'-phosphopantetheinyl transferase
VTTLVDDSSARLPLAAASRTELSGGYDAILELWVLRVADVETARLDVSMLDEAQYLRATKLRQPADRFGYIAAHLLLGQLLSRRLGLEPRQITYRCAPCHSCGGPHGRPELDGPARWLHFSIARSRGMVLIGLAPAPVGVDIEALPQRELAGDVVALLHPAERREIRSAPRSQQTAAFARAWTRKEAYLKGTGTGITQDLAAVYLGAQEDPAEPPGWAVIDVPVVAGYAAAAAIEDQPDRLRFIRRLPHRP